MRTYDITILTAEPYLAPASPDWYVEQILLEDRLVREALERRGLRVHRTDWTDRAFDWSATGAVLFRAVWDYTSRYDEFLAFLHRVNAVTTLINPLPTILWNLDKHYLRDLEQRGIHIPPTLYIEKGSGGTLREFYERCGHREAILKPAMSAGARHTYRLNGAVIAEYEPLFRQLVDAETMMLQPFLPSVLTSGEVTLVVIGGRYTHAIRKTAKAGDFRVQDDFGGTVHRYVPTQDEIAFAERTVSVCSPVPYYARVDMLRDEEGRLVVSELEAVEPELWFRFHPEAAERLAEVIAEAAPAFRS
ncbi:MAG: hypothetical protein HUU02_09465 [Bacteroidetes bacterium]|nr:hypothetical protein [Bacteroidota bacterium]